MQKGSAVSVSLKLKRCNIYVDPRFFWWNVCAGNTNNNLKAQYEDSAIHSQ